ncbi:hypothetical protein JZ785_25770 [Alicyclobacillus curvatus]|jgi:hypothetical protein|nr:hypothetical protein JZ785_25770 [Alicyclobacillus curvatus]
MNQGNFEAFVMGLPEVQREENFGYSFFFVGTDHRLPFFTIADSDNEYDDVSNLNREGVFRLNIGVSKETFRHLCGDVVDESVDYSMLNVFLPHPQYSRQHFVCILNPFDDNVEKTKQLIIESHAIAQRRVQSKAETKE